MIATLIAIAILTLASAMLAMLLRNLIHSALLLVASWAGIAAFYMWAGAEFVAFAQVLVYIGAVSMVVLFAVLLTRRSRTDLTVAPDSIGRILSAVVTGGAVCGVLTGVIWTTPLKMPATTAPVVTVREIGRQLMGPQAAALLVVGVLLTLALLGGVVIAATDHSDSETPSRKPGDGA